MKIAKDKLISPAFGEVSAKFHTPQKAIITFAVFSSLAATFLPIEELAKLCNIGTLAAFEVVCIGVIVLRITNPNQSRPYKCPGSPIVPALGALASFCLMISLPIVTWEAFAIWISVGLIIYFSYSYKSSSLANEK